MAVGLLTMACGDSTGFAHEDGVAAECLAAADEDLDLVVSSQPYFLRRVPGDLEMTVHDLDRRVLYCSASGEEWVEITLGRTWQRPGSRRTPEPDLPCASKPVGIHPVVYEIEYGGFESYRMLTLRAEGLSKEERLAAIRSISLVSEECRV